ncbi:hypothetical protein TNCV_1604941 [Trichonephila clavipes]|nr:hypothetical protein TNCV_1604941 [Trichonephila clavipes]
MLSQEILTFWGLQTTLYLIKQFFLDPIGQKAAHLEIVSDLTSEAFLASLRRFIARRSKPSIIWSDNATNFIEHNSACDVVSHSCVRRLCGNNQYPARDTSATLNYCIVSAWIARRPFDIPRDLSHRWPDETRAARGSSDPRERQMPTPRRVAEKEGERKGNALTLREETGEEEDALDLPGSGG